MSAHRMHFNECRRLLFNNKKKEDSRSDPRSNANPISDLLKLLIFFSIIIRIFFLLYFL